MLIAALLGLWWLLGNRSLLSDDPGTPETAHTQTPGAFEFYTQGVGYLQQYEQRQNIDAAIDLFERALEVDSAYAPAHAGLGEAFWRTYDDTQDTQWIERAIFHSQRALELDGQLDVAYVTLGLVDTKQGRYGSAIANFQHALTRAPANATALRGLAKAYEAIDRFDEAEATYRQAIDAAPAYWGGYNDLGVFFFKQSRFDDAVVQFKHVIDLAPLNARGYRNLGAIYFYLKRPKEAIAQYEQALDREPDYRIYSNLAAIYYHEGRYAKAAQTYQKALELDDSNYRLWGNLGSALRYADRREEAEAAYRRAIEGAEAQQAVNPRDPMVLSLLAAYHASLEAHEPARAWLEQATTHNPADVETLVRIGETYEHIGDRTLALYWLERAFKQGYAPVADHTLPWLNDLRTDPRYQRLLAQYGPETH